MIQAVFFDLDGVLADLCHGHFAAFNQALDEIAGFTISDKEHIAHFNGLPTHTKIDMLVEAGRLPITDSIALWQRKQDLTEDTIRRLLRPDDEKIELHKYLRDKLGLRIVCVTNSIRRTALLALECTGQLAYMDLVISNEDIDHPKPDPEGYEHALDYFDLNPEEAIIVEDSPKGLAAADATECHVLAVQDAEEVTLQRVMEFIEDIK